MNVIYEVFNQDCNQTFPTESPLVETVSMRMCLRKGEREKRRAMENKMVISVPERQTFVPRGGL